MNSTPLFPARAGFTVFAAVLTAAWVSATSATPLQAASQTALDRYVAAPDPSYTYSVVSTVKKPGYTTFVISMTSQTWLTEKEVDKPVWKHWMTIVKPDEVTTSKSLLMIGGGSNDRPAPKDADANMIGAAMATKSVVTELRMVPSEPLTFKGETKSRTEDGIIAYSWDKFLRTGDEKWPLRLPMTKSAVRAMDTVTAFMKTPEAGGLTVDRFIIAGGSKRGWTTWTTGAVDKRVEAVIPIVIDMLNIVPSFKHHYAVYGFYAPAVGDYTAMGIMDWQDTPEYRALMKIEEPFEYRDRLTMPKFIINSTGDQFFLPDSSQFYFKQLKGVKYLRYVPNSDHSLRDSDAFKSLVSNYYAILNKSKLPEFNWTQNKDGSFEVHAKTQPKEVRLWQASNPQARDFRLEKIGPAWTNITLKETSKGTYSGKVPTPTAGFTAYFVELTFDQPGAPAPFKFTTDVKVLPDVEPFSPPTATPKR